MDKNVPTTSTPVASLGSSRKKFWVIVAVAILAAMIVFVIFATTANAPENGAPAPTRSPSSSTAESSSDEVTAIEQDLDATELESLDAELTDINSEIR